MPSFQNLDNSDFQHLLKKDHYNYFQLSSELNVGGFLGDNLSWQDDIIEPSTFTNDPVDISGSGQCMGAL